MVKHIHNKSTGLPIFKCPAAVSAFTPLRIGFTFLEQREEPAWWETDEARPERLLSFLGLLEGCARMGCTDGVPPMSVPV